MGRHTWNPEPGKPEWRWGRRQRPDDSDGCGILQIKAHQCGGADGKENTKLGGSAEKEHNGLGEKGTEINHGSDTDKQQNRERFGGLNPYVEQPFNDAVNLSDAGHGLVDDAGQRKIDENGAEAHGQKQRRLVLLFDCEINEQEADKIHNYLLGVMDSNPS